jgi:hypothetical protein
MGLVRVGSARLNAIFEAQAILGPRADDVRRYNTLADRLLELMPARRELVARMAGSPQTRALGT